MTRGSLCPAAAPADGRCGGDRASVSRRSSPGRCISAAAEGTARATLARTADLTAELLQRTLER